MTNPEAYKACAKIIGVAIRNSRKFNKEEQSSALKNLSALQKSHPEWSDDIDEWRVKVGNVSAASQALAKGGLVSHGDTPAWVNTVAEMIDEVALEEKMESTKQVPTPNKPPTDKK